MELERISLAIEPDLLRKFDRVLAESGVANRSEAVRDLIRKRLVEEEEDPRAESAASLTLVYDHDTRETIREAAERHGKSRRILIAQQDGRGKGDAVRMGFSMATREIFMILDADLTVPPEDLPRFYRAITP